MFDFEEKKRENSASFVVFLLVLVRFVLIWFCRERKIEKVEREREISPGRVLFLGLKEERVRLGEN